MTQENLLHEDGYEADENEASFSGTVASSGDLRIGDTGYMVVRYRVKGEAFKESKGDSIVKSHTIKILNASKVDASETVGDQLLREFESAFNRIDEQVQGQQQIAPDNIPGEGDAHGDDEE